MTKHLERLLRQSSLRPASWIPPQPSLLELPLNRRVVVGRSLDRNRFLRYASFTLFSLLCLLGFTYCVSAKRLGLLATLTAHDVYALGAAKGGTVCHIPISAVLAYLHGLHAMKSEVDPRIFACQQLHRRLQRA